MIKIHRIRNLANEVQEGIAKYIIIDNFIICSNKKRCRNGNKKAKLYSN